MLHWETYVIIQESFLTRIKGGFYMCKVKTGRNVCTNQDVQNLVTSVILRQKCNFNRDAIIEQIENRLQDSEVQLAERQVEKMVSNTLGILECNGVVGVRDGMYSKKNVLFV